MRHDAATNSVCLRLIAIPLMAILFCTCGLGLQPVLAATNGLETDPLISADQLEADRKAAASDTTLDETQKQKTLEFYDQTSKWLQQITESRQQLSQFQELVEAAPRRIEAIRTGKAQHLREMPDIGPVLTSDNLERIELALTQEGLALQLARDAYRQHADELAGLLVGSKGLSEDIVTRSKTLEQIEADIQALPTNDPAALRQAHILMLKARWKLGQSELDLLKLRLGSHDLLTNLAQTEKDMAAVEITDRQHRLDALSEVAQKLREDRARLARKEAEKLRSTTDSLPRALQTIAEENTRYRLELEELVSREQFVIRDLQARRSGLEDIQSDYDRTRQRVDVVGETEAIGRMLKRRRDELPSTQSYRRSSDKRAAEISKSTDRQIEIDERLREFSDMRSVVADVLEALPESDRARFEQETMELARARRNALNELQKVYGRYMGQITSLDMAERQLVDVASAYIDYIDDRLIWIPGPGISTLADPGIIGQALVWVLSPNHWKGLVQDVWTLIKQKPLRVALMLVLFIMLLIKRKNSIEQLGVIAHGTHKIRTDSFKYTLMALLHTLVIIGAWPLLIVGSGWLLGALPTAAPFTLAMASGLVKAGMILLSLRFLIQLCMPDGVGDQHLRWPQPVREALLHEFRWILPIAVPLGFFVSSTIGNEPPVATQSLGRLAFILLMMVSCVFVFRLLRQKGMLMQAVNTANANSIVGQLHFLWFPLLVSLPVAFALTSAWGYHYTALHLEQLAELTFWFFVGLFLLKELLLRSLYIADRRLRLEDAIRRRDEMRAKRAQNADDREEEMPLVSLDIPELDFAELSEQNKRLVRAGFLFGAVIGIWSIWNDLLPALGFLNNTELPFHATRIIDGISKEVPVSLGDLILGLIMVVISVLAAKNIPGVLEITLLQRLPLDNGERYAITTLSQYFIAGVGIVVAFSTLGLQWSSIQWLVAALSVGLGFGLQEIVANFISGIILLFERPIRVGDVVTVNNTTGVVSRIRIRATTITKYDKQELLIPNKQFITAEVTNWTLSDKLNRVLITVGVDYSADVDRAMELMLEAATQHPEVLEDPKPVTSFEAFGDSALTLMLRSYLGSMDNRLATITDLHKAIREKLNAAGISIAFPQRDIHMSTLRPLDITLHKPSVTGSPSEAR